VDGVPGEDARRKEYSRQRAERRRLQELEQRKRMQNEAAVRLVLDSFFPAGVPDELIERICRIQNHLIKEVTLNERVIRELHDGINRIGNEAAQREVNGFDECARQVRTHGEELGLSEKVIDSLLRNHVSRLEAEKAEKNRAATQQVEWSRT
jgi:hypothetical protein